MYLLPKENPATRKIMESPTIIPCDIYTEMDNESIKQQIEEFMKFIESHINKIRKNPKTSAKVCIYSNRFNFFFIKSEINIETLPKTYR